MKETVLSIIKVIFAQLVLTAVAILLASFITYKLKVNDFGYKVIVMVVYGIVTFIGGMIIGKVKKQKEVFMGSADRWNLYRNDNDCGICNST